MAGQDSISNKRQHFVRHTLKDFYHADELKAVLADNESTTLASDALVGMVSDETDWDPEFLVDYLADIPQDVLRNEYPEFSPGRGLREWKVALQAAHVGRQALLNVGLPTLAERKPFIIDSKSPSLKDDLHNTIVALHDNARIDRGHAQGLLFLFEQATSSADKSVQSKARTQTRIRLKKDIALTKEFSDTKLSGDTQASLAVLNLMLKVNMKTSEGHGPSFRTMSDVVDMYVDQNKHMSREDVEKRIEDYVAHGLAVVYAG